MIHKIARSLFLLSLCVSCHGFAGLTESVSTFLEHPNAIAAVATSAAATASTGASTLLSHYTTSLAVNPLSTKMTTGAILATMGDAIAQSRTPDEYDKRRAASFAAFDVAYRAAQHALFPLIVAHCHGQILGGLMNAVAPHFQDSNMFAAAMEQTLASQLGIVPFLYYPVFFTLTGAVQGLSFQQSWERAQENFLPLMKRNLIYWIPVQFVQFAFVETSLQIPFLCVCGLLWTFLLSIMAGSTKNYSKEDAIQVEELPLVLTANDDSVLSNVDLLENDVIQFDRKGVVIDETEEVLLTKEQ